MSEISRRNGALAVLLIISAFNWVDRLALGLLLQEIKIDLVLSDTQLGLLTGIAFAIFYSLMGIPIGRWADRGNRVTIIVLTTALWSIGVALCATAQSFLQLLLIRVCVAIGEAGCVPPAHSLLSDYFGRAERPRAFAIYMLGIPIGMIIGYFPGGWLNELFGWRTTFVFLGLPGLGLATLAWLTLCEPRVQRVADARAIADTEGISKSTEAPILPSPGVREVLATLWANRTFRHLLLCLSVSSFFGYGIVQWEPAFFIRSYSLETGRVGTLFAGIYGLGGLLGTYLGGFLASRYAARNERLQLKVMAFAYASFGAFTAGIFLSPNEYLAFEFLALAALGGFMVNGPVFAMIQTLVPERMRAIAIALILLFANLIGLGLGPLAVGILSDTFRPWAGEESLRYALLILSPGYLWAGWHAWLGAHHLTEVQKPALITSTRRL